MARAVLLLLLVLERAASLQRVLVGHAAAPLAPVHSRRAAVFAQKGKGKGKKKEDESPYRSSVSLPITDFSQRAMATKREPELQQFWEENKVYERLAKSNLGAPYVLHDGPPYANGDLHIGHALNKILKDIINRYQLLQGRRVNYVPGWDCHGLPIELKVLQSMKSKERDALTPIKLRKKAAAFAQETVGKQAESFKRYGVWGDFDNPYLTLQPKYEAAQIGVFGEMFLKGHMCAAGSRSLDL
jgi:isoleucyl-tRNA synthetase